MIFEEIDPSYALGADPPLSGLAADVATLFDEHARALLRYVSSRLDPHSAEDVVSETFIIAMRLLPSLDVARSNPRAWLLSIAANLIRNHTRGEGRRQRLAQSAWTADSGADDQESELVDRLDAQRRVRQLSLALDALSDADREVLLLSAVGELNATEIAEVLGIRSGTARSRLHRARKQLRESAPPVWDAARKGMEPRHV